MIFYGFLLFLSFTRPVRGWRYRWALISLQAIAALNILMIGFSRVYEGEHWAVDVLGGYLSGAVWVTLFVAFIVHAHKAPWPVELDFTKTIQGAHPIPYPVPVQPHSWVEAGLFDVSQPNNPIPSVIAAVHHSQRSSAKMALSLALDPTGRSFLRLISS